MSETDRLLKVAEIDESGITITLPNTIPGKSSTPKNSPRSFDAVETLELENNENTTTLAVPSSRWEKAKMIFKGIKFLTLLLIFLTICIVFGTQFEPNEPDFYSLSNISNITVKLPYKEQKSHLQILLSSPIEEQLKAMSQDVDLEHLSVTLFIQTIFNQSLGEFHHVANHTMEFFKVNATHEDDIPVEDMFLMRWNEPRGDSRMIITTNSQAPIPLKVTILHQTVLVEYQVAIAFIIFIGVYSLIILDVVSRPLAGLIGVFAGITGLALVQQRPSIREMAAFVDWGALGLVFGMMLVFGIFKGSGVFEWSALRAYKLARGRMWPLMVIMSLFCFFVSMFIDNVTLMLLMTPITFQICEVIDINPLPLLITECLFGNIGGAGAPLSEEFVIILNNSGIQKYNLSFARSLLILFPGALLGALVCFIPVRLTNSAIFNKKAVLKPEKAKLLEQAAIWKKSLTRYHTEDPDATPEEQKVREVLLNHITSLEEQAHTISDKDEPNLENLEKQYRIHNKPLLIRSTIIISILLFLFVIESFIHPWIHLSLPWIALMGAVSLLLFSGIDDIEHVFQNEIECMAFSLISRANDGLFCFSFHPY